MDVLIRMSILILMIVFAAGCKADDSICSAGGKITLADESLGDIVAHELDRNTVPYMRIGKATFCYESAFHSQVTKAVIAAREKEHPIGRIDVVRTIEPEVKEALDAAGIGYSASIQGGYLILIVDPDNLERANDLIDSILEERY